MEYTMLKMERETTQGGLLDGYPPIYPVTPIRLPGEIIGVRLGNLHIDITTFR
jgi:hypothetical protein